MSDFGTARSTIVQDLSFEQRLVAAPLLIESLAGYYALLALARDDLIEALVAEMTETTTELGNGVALIDADDVLVGVFCGYPAEELPPRQVASLYHLVSRVDADTGLQILEASARHAAGIERVPDNSYYMARMGIAPAYRGRGVSSYFYRVARAAAAGRLLSLHVEAANGGAVGLHHREGLSLYGASDGPFLCMTGP
ncbi:GNAT family N-acetyltransferase [Sphingomonas sp. SUN039]|uniref:GNAT family N-acetyltransferase n=1 Tax=Sphingomonas sp. SUN039 TaxID=2937787 RepID=UPI00216461C6|nr:GNAT family N-acetyltransferase [Sphingomonas sp. SUN039]UVO52866.1 hypothetical protein M0209_01540 [Sphingomonas sp. SUN039]